MYRSALAVVVIVSEVLATQVDGKVPASKSMPPASNDSPKRAPVSRYIAPTAARFALMLLLTGLQVLVVGL